MKVDDYIAIGYLLILASSVIIYFLISYFGRRERFFTDLEEFLYVVDYRYVSFKYVCLRFRLSDSFVRKYGDEIKARLELHNTGAVAGHPDPEE